MLLSGNNLNILLIYNHWCKDVSDWRDKQETAAESPAHGSPSPAHWTGCIVYLIFAAAPSFWPVLAVSQSLFNVPAYFTKIPNVVELSSASLYGASGFVACTFILRKVTESDGKAREWGQKSKCLTICAVVGFFLLLMVFFGNGNTWIFSVNNMQSLRQHTQIEEWITHTLLQEGLTLKYQQTTVTSQSPSNISNKNVTLLQVKV